MDMDFDAEEEVPLPLSGEQLKIPKPAGEVGRPGSSRKGYSLADVLQWEDGVLEAVQVRQSSFNANLHSFTTARQRSRSWPPSISTK